jgi:UDP-2,3-diacylglucosamine hydrolase
MAPTASALPPAVRLDAPGSWREIDFISDLHLAAMLPRSFDAFAAHLRDTTADAVLILGDLFEFWPGSDAVQLPFEGRCAQVLADAARQRHVALMIGNRDFLLAPPWLESIGAHMLPDPTLLCAFGQRVLLTHGDALCLSDGAFQQFRAYTRNPQAQREFLARPLEQRVQMGQSVRHASEAGRRQAPPPGGWGDLDAAAATDCLRSAGATLMIHGHTHRPGDSALAPGFDRMVLSDWDLDGDVPRAEVLRWTRDGFVRIAPAAMS